MGTFKNSNITNIYIYSFARGRLVHFIGDIQSFSDNYNVNVNSEPVYGRIDPITTYVNTKREISFSFIMDSTTGLTQENFEEVKIMASRLYGRYKTMTPSGVSVPVAVQHSPPLHALHVPPLVVGGLTAKNIHTRSNTHSNMLPGFITSFGISYNTNQGVELATDSDNLVPREITVSISFSPIHDRAGGFSEDGKSANTPNWPY